MNRPQSARLALRAATAGAHDRVDRLFSRFALDDLADYARFLAAQAGAFLPLEAAVEAAEPLRLLPDWDRRRRAPLLRADLSELATAVEEPEATRALTGMPEVLGTIYVLEGSRLGGAMLARTVPDHFPRRFLGAGDPALWRTLIAVLDAELATEADHLAATHAAELAFEAFERSASRHREVADLA